MRRTLLGLIAALTLSGCLHLAPVPDEAGRPPQTAEELAQLAKQREAEAAAWVAVSLSLSGLASTLSLLRF